MESENGYCSSDDGDNGDFTMLPSWPWPRSNMTFEQMAATRKDDENICKNCSILDYPSLYRGVFALLDGIRCILRGNLTQPGMKHNALCLIEEKSASKFISIAYCFCFLR